MSTKAQKKKAAERVQRQARTTYLESHAKLTAALSLEPDNPKRPELLGDAESLAKSAKDLSTYAAEMVK